MQLVTAAECYLDMHMPWAESGWDEVWDKRPRHSYERRLVIAGALIAAELDRLRRQRNRSGKRKVAEFISVPWECLGRSLLYTPFDHLAFDQASWSQATFGTDGERGPLGALRHLEKEAREAQQSPGDPLEYADCLLLVLDAARRAWINHQQLVLHALDKMQTNKARSWPASKPDEPCEHERPATEDTA